MYRSVPLCTFQFPVDKLRSQNFAPVHKTTYNALYGPVRNVFDAGKSMTWASGRRLGPLALVMELPASKALRTGVYKS